MSLPRAAGAQPCIALFDLDGTLTWRDTFLPFLFGYVQRHPARARHLWQLFPAALGYCVNGDRGALKSRALRAVMGGEPRWRVEAWSAFFVSSLPTRGVFRSSALAAVEAHRKAGDRLVLLSASPDLYVPRIGLLLGFQMTVCTEVLWRTVRNSGEVLDGGLRTANRRGEEKARCLEALRNRFPGVEIIAYGNSRSDLPVLVAADHALLVNAGAGARSLAATCGIPTMEWK